MNGSGRKVLTAQLSPESYEGWQSYADRNNVTMTAIVEAFGLILPAGLPRRLEAELLHVAGQVVEERRSRRQH